VPFDGVSAAIIEQFDRLPFDAEVAAELTKFSVLFLYDNFTICPYG
jgi:hypothetical protein